MKHKIVLLFLLTILGTTVTKAQDHSTGPGRIFDNFFAFAWEVSIPMGENKFIDETSFAGGTLDYRKMVGNNVSVGFSMSWNSYYQYVPYKTYHYNANTDVTTDLYRFNYTLPLALTVHKYFPMKGVIMPFIGIGVGATYNRPSLFFNIYELYDENWGFLVRPEVGAIIKPERDGTVGILVGVKYSVSTNQEPSFKIDNLNALGLNLGLCWNY